MNKIFSYVKKQLFENRTVGFYLGLGAALWMLVSDVVYMILDAGALKIEDYSKTLAFWMILIGVVAELINVFVDERHLSPFLPILPVVFYAIGLGRQIYLTAYPIADVMTGVNWFGGNLNVYLTCFILFFIGTLTAIVSSFMKQRKDEK